MATHVGDKERAAKKAIRKFKEVGFKNVMVGGWCPKSNEKVKLFPRSGS